MYTEDDVASALRSGALSLEEAMRLFAEGKVYVYAKNETGPEAKWDEREDASVGSAELFPALYKVKATPEQIEEIKNGIRQAWDAGRTIESLWPAT